MTDLDLRFAATLYASTRAEEIAATGWPAEMQTAFLHQQHEAQHRHYTSQFGHAEWLIIERAGVAIGRLYLDERAEDFHIIDISLLPASRGNGLGCAILSDILSLARDRDRRVSLHVEKTNPARRLYERLGFKFVADAGVYDLMEVAPA